MSRLASFVVTIYITAKLPVSEDDITLYYLPIGNTFVIKHEGIRAVIDVTWNSDQLVGDIITAKEAGPFRLEWNSAASSASSEYDTGSSKDCEYIYDEALFGSSERLKELFDVDDMLFWSDPLEEHGEWFDSDNRDLEYHKDYLLWFSKNVGDNFLGMKPEDLRTLYRGDILEALNFIVEDDGEEFELASLQSVLDFLTGKGVECGAALARLSA